MERKALSQSTLHIASIIQNAINRKQLVGDTEGEKLRISHKDIVAITLQDNTTLLYKLLIETRKKKISKLSTSLSISDLMTIHRFVKKEDKVQ